MAAFKQQVVSCVGNPGCLISLQKWDSIKFIGNWKIVLMLMPQNTFDYKWNSSGNAWMPQAIIWTNVD